MTPEIQEKILEYIAAGHTMTETCQLVDISVDVLTRFRSQHPAFAQKFTGAQEIGFESQADKLLTIPDTYEDVNKARLKSDNLKWVLARRASSKYGDKVTMEINQTVDVGLALTEARNRLKTIEAQSVEIVGELEERATDLESVAPSETSELVQVSTELAKK